MATVKHVVLDSGAFLRNAPVQNIGDSLYTITDVVSEIRDKATKQRLQVLPYELKFREPSAEAISIVTEFAKKTGDYRGLSAVDIRVMALTYQLEKQFVGTDHIKTIPEKKVEWNASKKPLEKVTDIAGFYIQSNKSSSRTTSECSVRPDQPELRSDEALDAIQDGTSNQVTSQDSKIDSTVNSNSETDKDRPDNSENIKVEISDKDVQFNESEQNRTESEIMNDSDNQSKSCDDKTEPSEGEIILDDCLEELDESSDEEDDEEEEDDDGEGWITPSNIKSVKQKMGDTDMERTEVVVGCLTTDFSMQNVLIQMGLNVISVDGLLIKRAKSFVLRCFACMKITTNVQKTFCPHCGNKTLTKVSMTVNEDGSIKYFLSRRRPMNTRGTKYSLPLPKGGKHAMNPILVEDQPTAHNRTGKKAKNKMDVFNPDYMANFSPFNINDVTSKASQLGIRNNRGQTHYWEKRNPNEVKKNSGNRKK